MKDKAMKSVTSFCILGLLVFAGGLARPFALQGAGVVHWPRESFMLGNRDWVEYGIVIALIGVALMFYCAPHSPITDPPIIGVLP